MVTNINPMDLTGRKKAELAEKHAQEQAEAAKRMSTVTAAAEERKNEVIDLSGDDTETVSGVERANPKKHLRVNTKLENVTIGHGTDFNFEPGQKYKVDEHVYNYLDELGFVWH